MLLIYKTVSAVEWCREMKAIEAMSWAIFVVCRSLFISKKKRLTTDPNAPVSIFFIFTISLTTRAQSIGRYNAWAQSISDLPWWGEGLGNDYGYGADTSSYGGGYHSGANRSYPTAQQFPPGAQVIQQQPGHSLLIRPGHNGQPAVVQQVPGTIVGSQPQSFQSQGFIPPEDA